MPKNQKERRETLADPVYNDINVTKFINQVMRRGKKTIAKKIVYSAFDILKEKTKKEPLEVFGQALQNASPLLEVRPKRIGGATYQVPMEVQGDRKITLALRWIIRAAKSRKEKSMAAKLAEEIIEASGNRGAAVKKRDDTHRMAEANRAFAHFAW